MKYAVTLLFLSLVTWSTAQSLQLAQNYMDQGEYSKAASIYEKLVNDKKNRNYNTVFSLIDAYHQLEEYGKVDSLIDKKVSTSLAYKQTLLIEKGYNQVLQGNDSIASSYYQQAIDLVKEKPELTYSIASRFEKRTELDEAVQVYEIGTQLRPQANYSFQLARLYGELSDMEKMFEENIKLIEKNVAYRARAQALFSQYITDDALSETNTILRKVLLKRLRSNPDVLYNQLLSWLFVQQKDFKNAFIQEKAIYNRDKESMDNLQDLAEVAVEENDIPAAFDILDFMIENAQSPFTRYNAQVLKLKLRSNGASVDEYSQIKQEYEQLLEFYGRDQRSFRLQLDYARFLAFKNDNAPLAIDLLADLNKANFSQFDKARVKMLLADVLVLQEQFNRALILYSQIQNDLPNDLLAQESQYRVARTSFYKGDFPWALTQLKVLRSASSKLIANDAMQLSLTISDHSGQDTTYVALSAFAKAELKQYQNKRKQAIEAYNNVLQNHAGDDIEDEALLRQAMLYQVEGDTQNAIQNYTRIIKNHGDGILSDDALYELGKLYEEVLDDPAKAQEYFEQIIFSHADSIYFTDARRRYRRLRGDTNEKAF
ncbi:hypothetical protein BST91_00135 [Nonlabens tegetincola]|nr:tetratricopeptide repeat protein [Nonlabens tegetincola]ARN70179.1 hypothetical protein BST91_00135 [Nonlabens tegetincola]